MNSLIYRQGKMFRVNEELLPVSSRTSTVLNSLYYAMHVEFAGAAKNKKYTNCTNQEKISLINEFAQKWLEERKLI